MNWKGQLEMEEESFKYGIVYLLDDEIYGELISHGSYASTVRYVLDGIEYQTVMLNEDFDIIEEVHIQEIEEEY